MKHDMSSSIFIERFWKKVRVGSPTECWPWLGAKSENGYGQAWLVDHHVAAHRIAWSIVNGRDIHPHLDGCHACDNPPCCNPAHIWPGTRSENMRDAIRKGRYRSPFSVARGVDASLAKLTDEKVADIRAQAALGRTFAAIAVDYGVNRATVANAATGRTWSHVLAPVVPLRECSNAKRIERRKERKHRENNADAIVRGDYRKGGA